MTRILVTGKDGQVGWELQHTMASLGEVVAVGHREMDLADPDSIRKVVREIRPAIIVNPAAYTAVDKAESEPDLAMAINGVAPGILAEEAKRLNVALVHYSTDYVFDGKKAVPYSEEDTPNPLNVYGQTKLAGERAVQAAGAPYLILRTSWVYGARGRNFLLTILKLAGEKSELKIVDDQIGAPTWCRMLAETTARILAPVCAAPNPSTMLADTGGLYHLTAGGQTSWFGFATKILENVPLSAIPVPAKLIPIPTSEYPTPAVRPRNSRLSNEKITRTFGFTIPPWEESLALCMKEMNICA